MLAMCPSVVTLHGLHLLRRVAGLRRRLAVLNLRLILRSAGRTICVSRSEHEALLRAVGVQAGRRAVLVPNGVKTNPPLGGSYDAFNLPSPPGTFNVYYSDVEARDEDEGGVAGQGVGVGTHRRQMVEPARSRETR